jgi:DNA-binding NarL/FixJ family response regulator
MAVKVLLAFSNNLFSEGIAKLLEGHKGLKPCFFNEGDDAEALLKDVAPDIVLLDFITLYGSFAKVNPTSKTAFILVDTYCGEENIVSAFVSRRVAGILTSEASSELMVKAINVVSKGEVWIDNNNIKNLMMGLSALKGNGSSNKISVREKEIVALVVNGHRNREIAEKLCISEQTVKTHLYRIFKKLYLQNMSQLIDFALKNPSVVESHSNSSFPA